jgi:predicted molibdopterin-dependent oxidoreductase YjgC
MPGEPEVPFTLNGQPAASRSGETVLAVARRMGVRIPTLCHLDSVSDYGACRLCIVEVFWGKRSKLVTSCLYSPYENDRVETDNERVRRARRLILELLLARCPEVELLQELGREYGVGRPRFAAEGPARSERCILCGLCVRVCAEAVGQNAIGYRLRGTNRAISTPFGDQAEECIGCGACVFVCPTGALHYEDVDGQRFMKELNTRVPLRKCRVCGKPFATEKQVAKARERLKIPLEVAEACPRCRGAEFRGAMVSALHLAGPSATCGKGTG